MNLLLDTGISHRLIAPLAEIQHHAVWAGDPEDLGDVAILARGFAERRVVVCLDKDFGELAVHRQQPHCGIIRLVDFYSAEHFEVLEKVLNVCGERLYEGLIVTVKKGQDMRIREPESRQVPSAQKPQ